MSITNPPTDHTVVSGNGTSLANAYDGDGGTYGNIASSGSTNGVVNFITFTYSGGSSHVQSDSTVVSMYTYVTNVYYDGGGSVDLGYSTDGGSNWTYPISIIATESASTLHYWSISGQPDFTNVKLRVRSVPGIADVGPPIVYSASNCRVYEVYITYSGFYTAVTDQSAWTSTPYPVYSSFQFNTSTGTEDPLSPLQIAATYNSSGSGPYTYYRLTGATENP